MRFIQSLGLTPTIMRLLSRHVVVHGQNRIALARVDHEQNVVLLVRLRHYPPHTARTRDSRETISSRYMFSATFSRVSFS